MFSILRGATVVPKQSCIVDWEVQDREKKNTYLIHWSVQQFLLKCVQTEILKIWLGKFIVSLFFDIILSHC